MNLNKGFPFCFSTHQNKFPNEFKDKELKLFSLVVAGATPQRNYAKVICNRSSKTMIKSKLSLCSCSVPLGYPEDSRSLSVKMNKRFSK